MTQKFHQNYSMQILIAALNEEAGIGPTINDLNKKLGTPNILLIDGNSYDQTVKVAKDSGAEIIYQKGKGKGLALFQGLKHAGFKANHIVIIDADYTYPATGHSVVYCGAKPVFVDINPKTYNMDPGAMEEKITSRTRAVIPVHTFGQCADMDAINKLAK